MSFVSGFFKSIRDKIQIMSPSFNVSRKQLLKEGMNDNPFGDITARILLLSACHAYKMRHGTFFVSDSGYSRKQKIDIFPTDVNDSESHFKLF